MKDEPRELLPLLVELAGLPAKPPRGRRYGLKAVHADFESSRGFFWPFPGGRAVSPKQPRKGGPCPDFVGDGLCVALNARGAAQGGHQLSTVLIVSYTKEFGSDDNKVRVAWADVHAVVDVPKAARRGALIRADLGGANLSYADLRHAYLQGVSLYGADLRGVNLSDADLRGADLRYADLHDANLRYAALSDANLQYTDLRGADLRCSDLSDDEARRRGAFR